MTASQQPPEPADVVTKAGKTFLLDLTGLAIKSDPLVRLTSETWGDIQRRAHSAILAIEAESRAAAEATAAPAGPFIIHNDEFPGIECSECRVAVDYQGWLDPNPPPLIHKPTCSARATAAPAGLRERIAALEKALLWLLEWSAAPRYEGRHRTNPKCHVFMPIDADCNCDYAESAERFAAIRALAAAAPLPREMVSDADYDVYVPADTKPEPAAHLPAKSHWDETAEYRQSRRDAAKSSVAPLPAVEPWQAAIDAARIAAINVGKLSDVLYDFGYDLPYDRSLRIAQAYAARLSGEPVEPR